MTIKKVPANWSMRDVCWRSLGNSGSPPSSLSEQDLLNAALSHAVSMGGGGGGGGGGGTGLLAANNLSDVASVPTSRANLGLSVLDTPMFSGLRIFPDAWIFAEGIGSLRLGSAPSATPISYTLTIGESVPAGGSNNNLPGANGTIRSGQGTGTGAPGLVHFQTSGMTGAGSAAQPYVTRLTLGVVGTNAATFFGNVALGGTTDSFPALQASGTAQLDVIKAGGGGFAICKASQFIADSLSLFFSTPASATAAGAQGTIKVDAGFVYVCTATNVWKRATLATW